MEGSINRGTPQNGWILRENPTKNGWKPTSLPDLGLEAHAIDTTPWENRRTPRTPQDPRTLTFAESDQPECWSFTKKDTSLRWWSGIVSGSVRPGLSLELSEVPNAMKTHLGGDPKSEPAKDYNKMSSFDNHPSQVGTKADAYHENINLPS